MIHALHENVSSTTRTYPAVTPRPAIPAAQAPWSKLRSPTHPARAASTTDLDRQVRRIPVHCPRAAIPSLLESARILPEALRDPAKTPALQLPAAPAHKY